MPLFSVIDFLDLKATEHSALWKEGEAVWMALHRLENYLQERPAFQCQIEIPPFVHLEQPEKIAIGEGTILEPGVLIQGPCILGKGCLIRHGATLRGGVVCGDDCVIGHSAEIKGSILLDGARVAHLNYVGDSILGHRVNLGAGVKCANMRLDRREVTISFKGTFYRTGLQKFGCVVGDGSQIGCNSVLNPGTLLGPHSISYPLLNLHGVIPGRSRVKGKAEDLALAPIEVEILESMHAR